LSLVSESAKPCTPVVGLLSSDMLIICGGVLWVLSESMWVVYVYSNKTPAIYAARLRSDMTSMMPCPPGMRPNVDIVSAARSKISGIDASPDRGQGQVRSSAKSHVLSFRVLVDAGGPSTPSSRHIPRPIGRIGSANMADDMMDPI
jgi:hypothetical protein